MGIKQIDKILKIVVGRLKQKYHPKRVILFGSYAKNQADQFSDIDILMIADKYDSNDLFKRYCDLHGLTNDLEPDVNIFGATEKDISKYPTFKDAIKTGINLI